MAQRSLMRLALTCSSWTFVSRISGFARDALSASVFGASPAFDAFLIAFQLPNFFRRLFAEGAFSQAFVPVLTATEHARGEAGVRAFLACLMARMLCLLGGLVLLVMLFAPQVVALYAPGFVAKSHQWLRTAALLRWTFWYLPALAFAALFAGLLNSRGRFQSSSFTPVWLNVVLMWAMVVWVPRSLDPVGTLAKAVAVAGAVQCVWLGGWASRVQRFSWPRWRDASIIHDDEPMRRMVKLAGAGAYGAIVGQLGVVMDAVFASFLHAGSVSWLYFANRLVQLPIGLVGASLASVLLPQLSHCVQQKDERRFRASVRWGLAWVWVLGLPASVGLWLMGQPVVVVCFHHGAFDVGSVLATTEALQVYALGLTGMLAYRVVAASFYARQRVRVPVRAATLALFVNLLVNAGLVGWLGHVALALGTTVSFWMQCGWMVWQDRDVVVEAMSDVQVWQPLVASLLMAVGLLAASPDFTWWLHAALAWRVLGMAACLLGAVTVYVVALWALGYRWPTTPAWQAGISPSSTASETS